MILLAPDLGSSPRTPTPKTSASPRPWSWTPSGFASPFWSASCMLLFDSTLPLGLRHSGLRGSLPTADFPFGLILGGYIAFLGIGWRTLRFLASTIPPDELAKSAHAQGRAPLRWPGVFRLRLPDRRDHLIPARVFDDHPDNAPPGHGRHLLVPRNHLRAHRVHAFPGPPARKAVTRLTRLCHGVFGGQCPQIREATAPSGVTVVGVPARPVEKKA